MNLPRLLMGATAVVVGTLGAALAAAGAAILLTTRAGIIGVAACWVGLAVAAAAYLSQLAVFVDDKSLSGPRG